MPYQNSAGIGVTNHYGARGTGSVEGVTKTEGAKNQAVINFDGENFPLRSYVPAGATVTGVITTFATGTVSAATVGAVSVAGASTTAVKVPLGGLLTVTGPSAGYVIVEYLHLA